MHLPVPVVANLLVAVETISKTMKTEGLLVLKLTGLGESFLSRFALHGALITRRSSTDPRASGTITTKGSIIDP